MKTVIISIKNIYGKPLIYPVNEEAKMLVKLTGRKTFSRADIGTIKQLGFSVIEEAAYHLETSNEK